MAAQQGQFIRWTPVEPATPQPFRIVFVRGGPTRTVFGRREVFGRLDFQLVQHPGTATYWRLEEGMTMQLDLLAIPTTTPPGGVPREHVLDCKYRYINHVRVQPAYNAPYQMQTRVADVSIDWPSYLGVLGEYTLMARVFQVGNGVVKAEVESEVINVEMWM
ncbi:hypothetical protein VTN77DRAFT_6281 [Rasamsonia byssochlamydoides]|uniref:uncharacterized protein n=1 Tax=Rasamsonia byssochlamydoides TaxID=89139 RepID=UPI0037433BED